MWKFQIKTAFLFLCLFLIEAQSLALSKPVPVTNKKQITKEKTKKERINPDCNLSARSQKKIKSYKSSVVSSFFNEKDIEEFLDLHLDDIKKGWPNQCPKSCKAINDYSIFVKTYPLSVNKNSCNKIESKEVYTLGKKFDIKGDSRAAKKKAYTQARDWMFSVFVYPYRPFVSSFPKEFTENNLDKACPSCSFYLDYSYRYTTDNKLDLKATAHCRDKKTFFSNFQTHFFLVNQWRCVKES